MVEKTIFRRLKMRFLVVIACFGFSLGMKSVEAAILNSPVPNNAYITQGGLDWAWASPLEAATGDLDLSYQSQFGWRLPTLAELAFAPLATDFLFSGGNVPFQGIDPVSGARFDFKNSAYDTAASDGAVAVPYFSIGYYHADWSNGLGQGIVWAGMPGAPSYYAEQLVVRASGPATVPEPNSIAVFGLGSLVALCKGRRRALAQV
jgi:hypothetical protein